MNAPIPTELEAAFVASRAAFLARREPAPLAERLDWLRRLEEGLLAIRHELVRATAADFGGRAGPETLAVEVFGLLDELRHTRRRLAAWMRPRRLPANANSWPGRARVLYQPLGVVGVIGAYNYPTWLSLSPAIGALAAGNQVLVKPSELTPRASALLQAMVADRFAPAQLRLLTGDAEFSRAFASLPFDHLLFTGSTRVGRLVAQQAAANLTPVTLELGGRSPVLIGRSADLPRAVAEICHAKLLNAGQTCLAPDHVYVPEEQLDRFIALAQQTIAGYYPSLVANPDYSRIINAREHRRLSDWLTQACAAGAQAISVNPSDESCEEGNRVFAPTLVRDCPPQAELCRNEIFGPILPVFGYRQLDRVLDDLRPGPRPLALYLFSRDRAETEQVLRRSLSGGVTVNGCIYHAAQHSLALGGVGDSGMGRYHGFDGFETFSHKKPVFHTSRLMPTWLMRPPFGPRMQWLLGLLLGRRLRREIW